MYSQDPDQHVYEFHIPLANLVLFNLPSISFSVAFKLLSFPNVFFVILPAAYLPFYNKIKYLLYCLSSVRQIKREHYSQLFSSHMTHSDKTKGHNNQRDLVMFTRHPSLYNKNSIRNGICN